VPGDSWRSLRRNDLRAGVCTDLDIVMGTQGVPIHHEQDESLEDVGKKWIADSWQMSFSEAASVNHWSSRVRHSELAQATIRHALSQISASQFPKPSCGFSPYWERVAVRLSRGAMSLNKTPWGEMPA